MTASARLLLVLLLLSLADTARAAPAGGGAPAPREEALSLGMMRPFGVQAGVQSARLMEEYFTQKLGREVSGRLFPTYEELARAIAKGEVDVAWVSPLGYVLAAAEGKVTIIRKASRNGLPYYRSVFFVRADTELQRLGDVQGKRVAWGPVWSASANVVPRALLLDEKVDVANLFSTQIVLNDHAAVCNAVARGEVDVGASFANDQPDLSALRLDGCLPGFAGRLETFRIIYTSSDPVPNDVFVARPGLPPLLVTTLAALLDGLKKTDKVLTEGFRCEGFFPGDDRDFETLRRALKLLPPSERAAMRAPQ